MNTAVPCELLIQQLNWRYATKQFNLQRKISPEDWAALEEALILTPSSFGLQPWKFLVVDDPDTRDKLVHVSHGQEKVARASHLVVFTVKKNFGEQDIEAHLKRITEVRGISPELLDTLRGMMISSLINGMNHSARKAWATTQTFIALGNFLTSAALLGIDACPMAGFEPEKYDEILELDKQSLSAVVIAVAGYRAEADKYATLRKVRFPKEEVLQHV
ncbi:MAG TPA: NAD(P)H-dependent oxidoreductase [Candidatus Sulfotelmatobacter sp.]|jgi:nitroreductase|nr:NAD(P)H-dependent oxidoreductase [Candidatus Sulfotelmatobacter sp.]